MTSHHREDPRPRTAPAPVRQTGSLSVGQLAGTVGIRADTVRFYERSGLLPPAQRTSGEHRRYDEAAVDRLRFIRGTQRLGLRLREVRTLLQVRDAGTCPCAPARQLLDEHLRELDAELARLTSLRAQVVAMGDALAGRGAAPCPEPTPGTWLPGGGATVGPSEAEEQQGCCDDGTCCDDSCEPGCC